MFYASRFLSALSELGGFIVHPQEEDEDAMFEAVRQSKKQKIKPAEAAVAYFVTHARSGLATEPEKWLPVVRDAIHRARIWEHQKKVSESCSDMIVDLLRNRRPDETGKPEQGADNA